MKLKFKIQNRQPWRVDADTGFLRARAIVIQDSVMPYYRSEIDTAEIPDDVVGDPIYIYAPKEEFTKPEALESLKGILVSLGHNWKDISSNHSIGHVMGESEVVGDNLEAEVLLTDKESIRRIQLPENDDNRLTELSGGYEAVIDFKQGRTTNGRDYSGIQQNFKFNHIALLTAGQARGGRQMKLSNQSQEKTMDYIKVRMANGNYVRVAEEDVHIFENAEKEKDEEKIKNQEEIDKEKEKKKKDAENAEKEKKEMKTENSNLKGELQVAKEELDKARSPEVIQNAAKEIAKEMSSAEKIMNSIGGKVEDIQELSGDGLKAEVVKRYRTENKLPELTAEQLKDQAFVNGLYHGISDFSTTKQTVSGAHVVSQLINNSQDEKASGPKRKYAGDK